VIAPEPDLPPSITARIDELARHWHEHLTDLHPEWAADQLEAEISALVASAAARLGPYTRSVEAIQAALARHAPALAQRVIVVTTDYDLSNSQAFVQVWPVEDEATVQSAMRVAAPRMHIHVYSSPLEAI
jgi:hypothetical protein